MIRLGIVCLVDIEECDHSPEDESHVEEWDHVMTALQDLVQFTVMNIAESLLNDMSPSVAVNTSIRWGEHPIQPSVTPVAGIVIPL